MNQIYHQDEYRWATVVNPTFGVTPGPHPPLTLWLLELIGGILGYDYLRIVPLFISLFNLILIYFVATELGDNKKIGLTAAFLYAVSVYGAIASLQIDIDGATLPLFTLLSYWAYRRVMDKRKYAWWILGLSVIGGIFTKESFALCLAAIAGDWWLNAGMRLRIPWHRLIRSTFIIIPWLVLAGLGGYFLFADIFAPVVRYSLGFKSFNFTERAYGDLAFKIVKSLMLASPLLLLAGIMALLDTKLRERYSFWWLYLGFNAIFYTVLFDFTKLTIERYFMFMIIPLCIIGAEIFYKLVYSLQVSVYSLKKISTRQWLLAGAGIYLLILILIIPHDALPLNPKNAYVERIMSLGFNFLIPFTGGSGPIGFYASALYTAVIFLVMGFATFLIMRAGRWKTEATVVFLVLGVFYNLVFSLEYLTGWLYGSVPQTARAAVEYVNRNPDIKEVITYYDIGAYELHLSGKYLARFYTAPTRDYTERITRYRGHYLIVDFPGVGTQSVYWKLISRCPVEKQFTDKQVTAYIFNCTGLPL